MQPLNFLGAKTGFKLLKKVKKRHRKSIGERLLNSQVSFYRQREAKRLRKKIRYGLAESYARQMWKLRVSGPLRF